MEATNNVCNLSNVDTDANPLTLYNNAVPVCNGTTAVTDYDENFTSWTAGANYSFTDSMSAYVRVNRGGHFLDFDNGIRGSTAATLPPMQVIENYEGGFKFQNELFYADISAYFHASAACSTAHRRERRSGTQCPPAIWFRIEGCELHRCAHAGRELQVPGGRQLSDGEYTDYDACVPQCRHRQRLRTHPGRQLQHWPKERYMLTPSYKPIGNGDIRPTSLLRR
jgi:hypothetical protein